MESHSASLDDGEHRPERQNLHSLDRSEVNSPPLPPPCFNPPAEDSPDPFYAVSPPPSDPNSPSAFSMDVRELVFPAEGSTPRRPDLRAVQSFSDEAILSSPSSQGSATASPLSAEGQEHLSEMRERLLSESSSAEGSRRGSESDLPAMEAMLDVHVISPTPPLAPFNTDEAGPSRKRSMPPEPSETSKEHAWDSVWPAAGSSSRPTISTVPLPPFVPAPVSPFVTPTFSAHKSRRPPSPISTGPLSPTRRTSSPSKRSPRGSTSLTEAARDLQRLQTESNSGPSPPKVRHLRSASGTTMLRPILDSRPSYDRKSSPPHSPAQSPAPLPADVRPGSPIGTTWRKNPIAQQWRDSASPPEGSRRRRSSHSSARPNFSPTFTSRNTPTDTIPPLDSGSSFALPPAIATPPNIVSDDIESPIAVSPSTSPVARPAPLRRALSHSEGSSRSPHPIYARAQSTTANLDKSPKRSMDTASNSQPTNAEGTDEITRHRKSPRRSPVPIPTVPPDTPMPEADPPNEAEFVDEGDMLPSGDYHMDVTFDDEGLNALERIFLLSKSEFGFHRSYVARVLGDLLNEVDPCESVEYVLPLLSGFSMDEEEAVREAFAEQLHRILWYFFSTCRLVDETSGTFAVTSEGLQPVPVPPQAEETLDVPILPAQRLVSSPGPSSDGSSLSQTTSSMGDSSDRQTSLTSVSDHTAFSPPLWVSTHADEGNKPPAELVVQPDLAVNYFTPLLGSLLLNQNPQVSALVREGLVAVISRLRGTVDEQKWGMAGKDLDERRTFPAQDGPHAHDLRPFTAYDKERVETELLSSIILGMGALSTDVPDSLFDLQGDGMDFGENDQHPLAREAEAFRYQMVQEAQAGRATSLILIGSLCDVYTGREAVERGFLEEVLRSTDGEEAVRIEGAVALSLMAKIIPAELVDMVIPAFEMFAHDEIENIRTAVAASLPGLTRRIQSLEHKRSFAIEAVQSLQRAGDSCRFATLEVLGELIYIFQDDPQGPPHELLDAYKDDSDDYEVYPGDCDWDMVASFNFPGVCLTIGPDRWGEIRGLLARLQDRAGEKVFVTIASFLHELAKILHPAQVAEDLLPIYTRCLEASDEIRERVYEHVDVFLAGLPSDLAWSAFLGLAEAWKSDTLGGWRAREAVALHIPAFYTLFSARDVSPILAMTKSALLDQFAAVRDAATSAIPRTYEILLTTANAEPFRSLLLEFSTASHYRQRLTFSRCLREFVKPPPNRQTFEDIFLPALPSLARDVVDVRLAIAQVLADLFVLGAYYAEATQVPRRIMELAETLRADESLDVRDTIRNIDLEAIAKGKGVPHAVSVPRPTISNNALLPGGERPESQRRPSVEMTGKLNDLDLGQDQKLDSDLGLDDKSSPRHDSSTSVEETPKPVNRDAEGHDGAGEHGAARSRDIFASSFAHAVEPK